MTLEETLAQIKPLDKNAMDVAAKIGRAHV